MQKSQASWDELAVTCAGCIGAALAYLVMVAALVFVVVIVAKWAFGIHG